MTNGSWRKIPQHPSFLISLVGWVWGKVNTISLFRGGRDWTFSQWRCYTLDVIPSPVLCSPSPIGASWNDLSSLPFSFCSGDSPT
jgi:hypothetical protein